MPAKRIRRCPRCGSAQFKRIVYGLLAEFPKDEDDWVMGGCVIWGNSPTHTCNACGLGWVDTTRDNPTLSLNEFIPIKTRNVRVTEKSLHWLPGIRARLAAAAQLGEIVTYGQLKQDVGFPHLPQGIGRLLDLLSEDCFRRDEPSLAALVVNDATREVGSDFEGDPVAERDAVFAYWGYRADR